MFNFQIPADTALEEASDHDTSTEIKKGLAGVVVDYTAISKVNPETNSLLYRGYPVQELAANCSVRGGRLPALARRAADRRAAGRVRAPTSARSRALDRRVQARRSTGCRSTAHPMDVVRTAVSVIGAERSRRRGLDSSASRTSRSRVRLFAQLPAIVAYDQRRRRGLELVEPRDDLGYSAELPLHDLRRGARPGRRRARSTSR